MIARIAWLSTLFVLAVLMFGVQLDRQTQRTPNMADTVPQITRSSAQFPVAAYALGADDPQLALAEAERLVRRRPLPAEHLRLLAQAQFAAGALDESALTIQYAAQRGWRDSLAQEAMLRLALEAGDTDEAARRYAALFLRRDTEDALLKELGEAVFAKQDGEAQQTMATIVGGAERWHDRFLRRGARVMPPDTFAEIVRQTSAKGSTFECDLLRRSQSTIQSRDEAAGAVLTATMEQQC